MNPRDQIGNLAVLSSMLGALSLPVIAILLLLYREEQLETNKQGKQR